MRIDIITVLPELLKSPFEASILKRAIEAGLVEVHFHNLRDFATGGYKSVDDTQFGGGAGMVMSIAPIDKCISKLQCERNYDEIIYMTPDGEQLNQSIADSVIRLIPGVLGNETSALTDSFQDNLLAPPIYTKPREYDGMKVPEVLFSGNFAKIEKWREDQAYKRTQERRPDLLED